MIDFRSDTVTLPTPAMRRAMADAPLGDDVFGEDPSINALEEYAAGLFGRESALFCPSGTMTNQIGIKCHTRPGDEVICEQLSHVYQYEGGGIAFNSGCQVRLLQGDRGRLTAAQVEAAINPDDVHKAVSRLVCLENTTNRGGGACYDLSEVQAIRELCDRRGLGLHLDGARLFNALAARRQDARDYGRLFHSISICLSKGLGAPVGSLLIGDRDFIRLGRRYRKVFGGGMRQAGSLAAAGLYALQHQVQRLEEDHEHIRLLANALAGLDYVDEILPPETNILIFEVKGRFTAASLTEALRAKGIRVYAIAPTQVRLVAHLDITRSMIEQTITAFQQV